VGGKVATAAKTVPGMLARGAASGAVEGAGTDLLDQAIDVAYGERKGIDLKQAAFNGVVGGVFGTVGAVSEIRQASKSMGDVVDGAVDDAFRGLAREMEGPKVVGENPSSLGTAQGAPQPASGALPSAGPEPKLLTAGAEPRGLLTAGAEPKGLLTAGAEPKGLLTAGAEPKGLLPAHASSIPDTRQLLQDLTDRAVRDIQVNPALARDLMSPGSYRHLRDDTELASASFGKAVERLTARYVRAEPLLATIVEHTGLSRGPNGRFISSPDFTATEGAIKRIFDITTQGEIPKHARRYGAKAVEYLTYARPPGLFFP
jgi:hypothetical protein